MLGSAIRPRFRAAEGDALLQRRVGGVLTGVTLIDVRKRHFLIADFLYRLGQLADLIPVLLVGRGDVQRKQVAQRIDGQMDLVEPFLRFAPS